ncbi:MAG: hypothetical protein ACRC6X_00550 [Culicoidibacterales bacterium]
MRKLGIFIVALLSCSVIIRATEGDNGKLFLDLSQLDKNNIEQQQRTQATIERSGVSIFTPKAIEAYELKQAQQQQQYDELNNTLFLVDVPPQNLNPSAVLFQQKMVETKAVKLNKDVYFEMNYMIYVFVGFVGLLLAVFIGYLFKAEHRIKEN